MGEHLVTRSSGKSLAWKAYWNYLALADECGVAYSLGSVLHTSQHTCDHSLVLVGVDGNVAIGMGRFVVDTCAQNSVILVTWTSKECWLVLLV